MVLAYIQYSDLRGAQLDHPVLVTENSNAKIENSVISPILADKESIIVKSDCDYVR